ncbi:hypothetical protein niasHS_009391 [Heterodera schachtii]|uniref:Uncharacterized protein n=2 Tax=Heterodera TaxID=34509 RepID=A0ABD2JBY6_HETSC
MLPQLVPEHWAMSAQSARPSVRRRFVCLRGGVRCVHFAHKGHLGGTSSLVKSASSLLIPPLFDGFFFRRPMCSIATHKIQSTNSAATAAAIFIWRNRVFALLMRLNRFLLMEIGLVKAGNF